MLLQPRRALALRVVELAVFVLPDAAAVEAQRQPPTDHRRGDRRQQRIIGGLPADRVDGVAKVMAATMLVE